ncbi:MAG: metallophosphoesterase, partial [Bacteroidota bacterium]
MKIRKRNRFLLLGIFLLSLTFFSRNNPHSAGQLIQIAGQGESLRFAVIGDWGVKGKLQQKTVAKELNAQCQSKDFDFIITTGDNFYPRGVASIEDDHWKSSYEEIYQGPALNIPWYPVLGNHDYGGNVAAQFEYSNKSESWTFPAKYYAIQHKLSNGLEVLMLFLDTTPFQDSYFEEGWFDEEIALDSTAQKEWMQKVLSQSDADWKLVFGHHTLYTGGMRAKEKPYVRMHLEKLFQEEGVDAYICGHEHDIQHIRPPGGVEYFVSGAAAMARPTG